MGDARCGRTAGTAGRVCRPPQTARRQVSSQGGSGGAPRAGRGRTRGWGEGRGREPWGPKRLGPKRPSPGGKRAVIPSRALRLQAPQPAPSVVLTPTCLGMGPRSGRGQMLKRNPQPGRSECAASGTRAEWRSQETRAPVAGKESRPGRRNNGEGPQPPGRGKRRLAARCPGKSEENQLTEGRKIFRRERRTWRAGAPAGRGFTRTILERAEPAVVVLGSAQLKSLSSGLPSGQNAVLFHSPSLLLSPTGA